MAFTDHLAARLAAIETAGLRRQLALPEGVDVASNDYLGFVHDSALRERTLARLAEATVTFGAGAARLLRGTTTAHLELEARLAAMAGAEAALLFASGWQANVGLLSTVLGPADRVLSDERNHASLIDGIRLARCERVVYPHRDVAAVGAGLRAPHSGRTVIVTESVFSMDGTCAPLAELGTLAREHDALLVVDEAHAFGLWGARGSGLAEDAGLLDSRTAPALARILTFGKALGLGGAAVAGPRVLVDLMVSASRPFLFTTAPPPLLVLAVEAALDHLAAHPERAKRAHALADRLRSRLAAAGVAAGGDPGVPIVPVLVGTNDAALAVAADVAAAGFDARAVRPPTVAPGTARLRLSVHADHDDVALDALADAVTAALRRHGAATASVAAPR